MLDFLKISTKSAKRGLVEVYPKFIVKKSSDLMIRGRDFYAIWMEDRNLWSTDEQDAIDLIDMELDKYAEEHKNEFDGVVKVQHLWDSESQMIEKWHKYCQKHLRDNYKQLDENVIFSNKNVTKKDYASKKLNYPLEKGSIDSYERLISVLYSPEERHKIEWAIGAIISGESKKIQKFLVFYGSSGTGKSTILNIIQKLFTGYYSTFDAKALGSTSNSFALEAFKSNPLIAIQHDGDLSRIEDNTRLNSIVSHELMTVNEKFKSQYTAKFNSFLLMGTNKPVRITDAKSGLIRRLIDVSPTGKLVSPREYKTLMKNIEFELGAIAYHCLKVYESDPGVYDNYIPVSMIGASNDFYNFVLENYYKFKEDDETTLKAAWEMYKTYCEEARVLYPLSQKNFKEELKNYFENFEERSVLEDGTRVRSLYSGFKTDNFEKFKKNKNQEEDNSYILKLNCTKSNFDKDCADLPAQYATKDGTPKQKWADVTTKLSDIDTSQLHYVKVPQNHIVIDFDIPDENGEKSLEKNLEAASKWPPTYAEFSKSGKGIHLHYIYLGDLSNVSKLYDDHIEIKIFNGRASLRRKLTKCNNLPIATISSGLPLKEIERRDMVSLDKIKSEQGLRNLIRRNLNKEIHPYTKPSVDFIYKILCDAYDSDLVYDVSDMYPMIISFAAGSSHSSEACMKLLPQIEEKLKSKREEDNKEYPAEQIIFYDVEVFPNLFLVNWKAAGENSPVVRMINPKSEEIEDLIKYKLVGFNCRRYDNHILYARLMKYNNKQLYNLSQKIINGDKNAFFGEAYNLSYTDVYDFSSKKQSLKKFEIELGIHHQELGLPWDEPVPEELWPKVAEYCDNDVIATEAVFNARHADFVAREILADVAGMTVNDTTNSLTTRIIFGNNRTPQARFNYRNMGEMKDYETYALPLDSDPEYTVFDPQGRPMFPGYKFERGKSTYRGEDVGEGGYVYSEPGMYGNVALLDIASMHPSSIVAENLFGTEYTQRFKEILDSRIAIKHKDFDKAREMLGGKLAKYLTDEQAAKDLAQALKIAINSVYGLTAAHFTNAFRDPRNKDNIVAKRGALFMINLKHEVQKRGFKVAHIKTDSIKIPDATPEIISFVMEYGKLYGYNFEHEATYDRMCLVNDAVYIAKYKDGGWTATGTQFAVPYVFKTLFSHEPIAFEDCCETKEVKKGTLYLDMNESFKDPDKHHYEFIGRIGNFCPIKEGCGGGILYRMQDDKYYAATGTKGYRWLESEKVKTLGKEADIDEDYYKTLVTEAAQTIISYGDFEWFISDRPYKKPKYVDGKPVYPDPEPFMNEPEE